MHDLVQLMALGQSTARQDVIGPVTLAEIPDVTLASVAARQAERQACLSGLAALLGGPVPEVARFNSGLLLNAFWTGPDAWMVEARQDQHEDLALHIRKTLQGSASVTEQTDAWVRVDVTGDDLPLLFERLCNLDLRAAPVGIARRSVIEHVGCYVVQRGAGYSIFAPRSSARSLHHALVTAAHAVF